MRRGTTPPFAVEVVGEDWTNLNIHLTFEAGALVTKSGDDLTVTYADGVTTVSTVLTQEDTLSFTAGIDCEVQIRAYNADGSLADATTIGRVPVERILEDGKLPAGE